MANSSTPRSVSSICGPRYYDPSTGRFNRLDPFFGNLSDPQSLHKYLYTHADPVNGIDLSLGSCISAIGTGMRIAGTGAAIGVGINAIRNIAIGQAWHENWIHSAIGGAIMLPLISVSPLAGLALAGLGLMDSFQVVTGVFNDPKSTWDQKSAAGLYALEPVS